MKITKVKPLRARDIEVGAKYQHNQYVDVVYLGCGTLKNDGRWHNKHLTIIGGLAMIGHVVNLTRNLNWSTGFIKL